MSYAMYGLTDSPFELTPDPKYLYVTQAHADGLASMRYGVAHRKGFVLIVGEVGTGKTTLIRHALGEFGTDVKSAYVLFTPQTFEHLLDAVLRELGVSDFAPERTSMLDALTRFVLGEAADGRNVVVIVDEAQNLTPALLEKLRMLSNLETASAKLLQIVLVGQPELARKLTAPRLRQLRDRIAFAVELAPFTRAQTAEYIAHRLRVAGATADDLFTRAAVRRIHRVTRGIPRRINLLCDKALVLGAGAGAPRIGAKIVGKAASEWKLLQPRRFPPAWWRFSSLRARLAFGASAAAVLLVVGAMGVRLAANGDRFAFAATARPAIAEVPLPAATVAPPPDAAGAVPAVAAGRAESKSAVPPAAHASAESESPASKPASAPEATAVMRPAPAAEPETSQVERKRRGAPTGARRQASGGSVERRQPAALEAAAASPGPSPTPSSPGPAPREAKDPGAIIDRVFGGAGARGTESPSRGAGPVTGQ